MYMFVIGTRPEAIKLAPLVNELRQHAVCRVVCSGQHRDTVLPILNWFGIEPDEFIEFPAGPRSLGLLTSRLCLELDNLIEALNPTVIVAQGDTTTVFVAALLAFYRKIPFAHVEAGLRTHDINVPFPEEFNRVAVAQISQWHFCPTEKGRENLMNERISDDRIFVTGNTGIDALAFAKSQVGERELHAEGRQILVTAHRRENHGRNMENICRALLRLSAEFEDIRFLIPVHPNPDAHRTVYEILGGQERFNICKALSYPELVRAMMNSHVILTDSGGIQEEAPFLGKPVLVLRDVTERPEAVELGVAKLVGSNPDVIFDNCKMLFTDKNMYSKMSQGGSPYGDGKASARISRILREGAVGLA